MQKGINTNWIVSGVTWILTTMILGFFLQSCNIEIQEIREISNGKSLSYKIADPDGTYLLGRELKEISGLCFGENNNNLFCINDEEGRIFILDKEGSGVTRKIPFGKKGDYEGIEIVDNSIFVTKSTGTILELDTIKQDVKNKYNTSLKSENDVEGLGFYKPDSCLLLACKANAGIEAEIKNTRAIYKFDLKNRVLDEDPFLLISDEDIISFIRKHAPKSENDNQKGYFDRLVKRASHFAPSAIAVHPTTNEIYILSAVSKLLIVVDGSANIKHFVFLDRSLFGQPEGICFSQEGKMFISNEAAKGKANILSFKYQN